MGLGLSEEVVFFIGFEKICEYSLLQDVGQKALKEGRNRKSCISEM